MKELIWVRIFIAGLALFGESALASENNSAVQDTTSFSSLVADVSNHFADADTDSDNQPFIAHLQLLNADLQATETCWMFDTYNIPVQQKYLVPLPHAPPATLI